MIHGLGASDLLCPLILIPYSDKCFSVSEIFVCLTVHNPVSGLNCSVEQDEAEGAQLILTKVWLNYL